MDPFEPFRPLMRPLSGIKSMCLLIRGDKRILMIGETHQEKFCREQGFTPLSQIIEDYLASTVEPVDFMVEMDNMPQYYPDESTEARKISNEPENRAISTGLATGEIVNLISLTKTLLRPLKLPNARVHWLDVTNFEGDLKGTKLMRLFYHFDNSTREEKESARLAIDECLITDFHVTPPWSSGLPFDPNDTKSIQQLLFQIYNALKMSKYLRKCYGEYDEYRDTPPTFQNYWHAYIEAHNLELHFADINSVYFNIQRFFMDMYTCCRIMKRDKDSPRWYKNIVIYAGNWHVLNYVAILTQVGFEKIPVEMNYNPRCEQLASDPKRKQEESAQRLTKKRSANRRGGTRHLKQGGRGLLSQFGFRRNSNV